MLILDIRGLSRDLQFWRLREGEVEPGLGEEAVDEKQSSQRATFVP
jgi:hypothetical protein